MNMMTAIATAPERRLSPTMPELTARIRKALDLSGVTPTRFGVDAQCGKNVLADIQAGRRNPRWKVRLRLLDHADRLIEEARVRAFNVLMDNFERDDVEAAVEGLIAMLDARDGDPDYETVISEDDITDAQSKSFDFGPGCEISDAGGTAAYGRGTEDDEVDDEDCCEAGDDRVMSGPVVESDAWFYMRQRGELIGDTDDAEETHDRELELDPHA